MNARDIACVIERVNWYFFRSNLFLKAQSGWELSRLREICVSLKLIIIYTTNISLYLCPLCSPGDTQCWRQLTFLRYLFTFVVRDCAGENNLRTLCSFVLIINKYFTQLWKKPARYYNNSRRPRSLRVIDFLTYAYLFQRSLCIIASIFNIFSHI